VRLLPSIDALPAGLRFVAVLGMFDGVHVGHQLMLSTTVRAAGEAGAEPILITFDPHPEQVLRGSAPPLLCDPEERLAHFAAAGIAITAVQRFDREFSSQSPEVFLRRLAHGRVMVGLVMTPETAFGRDRTGTAAVVEQLSPVIGFRVIRLEQATAGGHPISSSRIRQLLAAGSLAEVSQLLGRDYAVVGRVAGAVEPTVPGRQAVAIELDRDVVVPPPGAYAARLSWGGTDPLHARHAADGMARLVTAPSAMQPRLEVEAGTDVPGDGRLRVAFARPLARAEEIPAAS